MFFRDVAETKYTIKINSGGHKVIYEFSGSKDYLELMHEDIRAVINRYRVKEKKNCGGCNGVSGRR